MKFLNRVVYYLSGEFLFLFFYNGGTVVLLRSLITSVIVFSVYIILLGLVMTGIHSGINWGFLHDLTIDNFEYVGAVFAGSYTLYYARFASQWTYLAGVYNQLMVTLVTQPPGEEANRNAAYAQWKAGIIEDAYLLHLAAKPMFAPLIDQFLKDELVRASFLATVVNGELALKKLEKQLSHTIKKKAKPEAKENSDHK